MSHASVRVVIDTHHSGPYTVYVSAYVGDLTEPLLSREVLVNDYRVALGAAKALVINIHGAELEDRTPETDRKIYE